MKKYFLLLVLLAQFTPSQAQEKDEVGHFVGPWTSWSPHSCYQGLYWRIRKNYYGAITGNFINEFELQNRYAKKVSFSFGFTSSNEEKSTGRRTLNSNETYRNSTLQNETKPIRLYLGQLCFEYYNYNGVVLENCSEQPEIYKKDFYYAVCDNGTPTYNKYSGGNASGSQSPGQSNSGIPSNSNSQTNNGQANAVNYDKQIDDLLAEKAKLCECNNRNSRGTSLCGPSYNREHYLRLVTGTENQQKNAKRDAVNELKNDIYSIKAALGTGCITASPTTSGGQENDLTAYNRSKQEMEQKLREENARRQQEATENSNKYQKYQSYYNAGVAAYNKGNWNDAATQFKQAIPFATTDEQRNTAQVNYDKANQNVTRVATSTAISNAAMSLAQSIDQIIASNRARKEAEKEKKRYEEQKRIDYYIVNKDYYISLTSLSNPYMGQRCDYLVNKLYKAGYTFKEVNHIRVSANEKSGSYSKSVLMLFVNAVDTFTLNLTYNFYASGNNASYTEMYWFQSRNFSNQAMIDKIKSIFGEMVIVTENSATYGNFNLDFEKIDDAGVEVVTSDIYKGYEQAFSNYMALSDEPTKISYRSNGYKLSFLGRLDEAEKWFKKAQEAGDSLSWYDIGRLKAGKGETAEAFRYYKYGEAYELPEYYSAIAFAFQSGKGVGKDMNAAVEYFKKAANKNDVLAALELALIYKYGRDTIKKDNGEEKKWRARACELNAIYCK